MYGNAFNSWSGASPWATMLGGWMAGIGILLLPLIIWTIFWKGWALWTAARNGSKGWFIALLILNTVGILDILYIFVFGKQKRSTRSRK